MRAVVVKRPGPVEALEVLEVAEPSPGPGEVTVEVAYAGVGFVDTLFRSGAFEVPVPFTPGIEVAGHVRAVGEGVTGFEVGQPVAAMLNDFGRGWRAGGYAEVAVAHASMTTRLPENADLARVAAVLINGVTAWLALHDLARLGVGDDVLVLGASGGLGGTAGRLAAIHPARRVIGMVGGDPERLAGDPAWTDVVTAADLGTNTVGNVDVVIDPVGGESRARAYEHLAPLGRLIVVGNASGEDRAITADSAWLNSRQVLGFSLGGVAHLMPERVGVAMSAVVGLLHRGVLREPEPSIVPLDRAAEVHHALETRTAPAKTILALR
jgi:NADPH2:quinone reductase